MRLSDTLRDCGLNLPRLTRFGCGMLRTMMVRACVFTVALFGLATQATAQQYSFRHYTPEDGLTNLAASALVRARNGDLWIGTDGGLYRFDGTSFTALDTQQGLPPDQVGGLALDPTDRLWVSLVRGLYVQEGEHFSAVRTAAGPVAGDFRAALAFLEPGRVLMVRGGHVLELQQGGALWSEHEFLRPAQIADTPDLANVRRLFRTRNGALWLGCGKQLCSLVAGQIREWGHADGVPADDWNSFLEDNLGRVWVRSPRHLIVKEAGARTFEMRDPPAAELDELRHNPTLVLDAQGRLLARTGLGLARWEGDRWKHFTAENGLPTTSIAGAQLDGEGNLWLAMNGLGLWRWRNYENLESWTRAQGLISDKIWSIQRDPTGRLLLGTSNGCQMLDELAGRAVSCPVEGLPHLTITSMAVDKAGGLWWGMVNGEIWHAAPGENRAHLMFAEAAERPEISLIRFDNSGIAWVACLDGGLFRLDPNTVDLQKVALPSGPGRIYDVTQDARGTLWVAGAAGLFRRERGEWNLVTARNADGNLAVFGSVAATPDGSIWGGPDGKGLLHLNGSNPQQRSWVQADIVTRASVYFVRADGRGWVWVGTDRGVIVFDGQSWRRIDEDDGLVWNDTQVYGFLADSDGSIWVGTSAGMTHIRDPQQLMGTPRPLDLSIATARLGSDRLDSDTANTIAWHPNAAFHVRFASHSYSRSPQTEFRYRLLGLSSDWFGSRNPELHLPALDAGEYRLEVVAIDAPHARVSPTIFMSLEVLPPWWRTSVFRFAVMLCATILVALAWRWQYNKLRARRLALESEFRERQSLLERATRDALTGLWNRATILDVLARETVQAQRSGTALAIGIIDVDHFKQINDTHGHPGGDEVLRILSRRLGAELRQCDWLGRYGGEELMMILPGLGRGELENPAERLRTAVCDLPFDVNGREVWATVSIGIARCESPTESVDSIVRRADGALYEAKRAGRNRVVYSMDIDGPPVESGGSRRYLEDLLDKVKQESQRRDRAASFK